MIFIGKRPAPIVDDSRYHWSSVGFPFFLRPATAAKVGSVISIESLRRSLENHVQSNPTGTWR